MKKCNYLLVFLSLTGLFFIGCANRMHLQEISLENTLDIARVDEAIVIKRSQIKCATDCLLPIVCYKDGTYLPCQLDDMDDDGNWDELAFVYNFSPLESVKLYIRWIDSAAYPVFKVRTNIRYGKMTRPGVIEELDSDSHGKYNLPRGSEMYPYQMDGPSWENEKIAFRQYFDGRNCCDIFGKKTTDLVLDTVGINSHGCPENTYQVINDWGGDILSVANSFGLGGIAMSTPNGIALLGVPYQKNEDVVDSTYYKLITEGPIRSTFRIQYKRWNVKGCQIDLCEDISIWAGKNCYEKKILTSKLPDNYYLVTGIVANLNKSPLVRKNYDNRLHAIITHDKQTVNIDSYLGMCLLVPESNWSECFYSPEENSEILKTWCVKMKPDDNGQYCYRAYSGWEFENSKFRDSDQFVSLIDSEALRLNNPVRIQIE